MSSDFGAINNLLSNHKTAATAAEAIRQYIIAGGSVQGFDFDHKTWHDSIVGSVANGTLPQQALDVAVRCMRLPFPPLPRMTPCAVVKNQKGWLIGFNFWPEIRFRQLAGGRQAGQQAGGRAV